MPDMGELRHAPFGAAPDSMTVADLALKVAAEAGLAAMKNSPTWPDQCMAIILLAGQTGDACTSGAVLSGFQEADQPFRMLVSFLSSMAADMEIPLSFQVAEAPDEEDGENPPGDDMIPAQAGRPSQAWPARVRNLLPGDRVTLGDQTAVFACRMPHPIWPTMQLVVWRLADGEWSLDALGEDQEVGAVAASSRAQRQARLLSVFTGAS